MTMSSTLNTPQQNIYETDELVSLYCDFQYGEAQHFGVDNFAIACAQKAIHYTQNSSQGSALDLGCATGRTCFELARTFDKVCGIDYSNSFVNVAKAMQQHNKVSYYQNGEGALRTRYKVDLATLGLSSFSDKVEFHQGDACDLNADFSHYDLILATNLIDRLYQPDLFLSHIHQRINDNGTLILTSPYTWLEQYTKKESWLGGYEDDNGNVVSSLDGLKNRLGEHFELVATEDVPFVIRETPRKYQHTIAQMSVWQKK